MASALAAPAVLAAATPRGGGRRGPPRRAVRPAGRLRAPPPSGTPRRGAFQLSFAASSQRDQAPPSPSSLAPAADSDGDAADGIVPAFGPGSPPWPAIHAELRDAGVRAVSVAEARAMLDAGAALADVRPRIEFEEFRPGDADLDRSSVDVRNVPYMVPHRSAAKRWQGYMLCTKDGLKERDPAFTRSFARRFPDKSAPVIVGCKLGGDARAEPVTIDPVTKRQVFPEGSSQYSDKSKSNSLMAMYELRQAGYTNLYHLEGGVTRWCLDGEAHVGDPNAFYFHPTILPGILFQLIMVEGIVVRSNLAYVKKFHPENFQQIEANNAAYAFINDLVANSPINWMFDYYN
jgi:rhodanese-related sulfurtransferase